MSPLMTATRAQTGVISDHSTTFLALSSLRNISGSSKADTTRLASGPRTFVEGTSEYIHAARISAKASVPCTVNSLSLSSVGRKNHAELIRAPLTATVTGVSYGG